MQGRGHRVPSSAESSHGRPLVLRGLTWLVLVAFTAGSLALFFAARRVGADQERRLLQGRTAEVAELLSGVLAGALQSSVSGLSAASRQPDTAAFQQAAAAISKAPTVAGVGLLERQGNGWVVLASTGDLPKKGATLTGPRASLLTSAATTPRTDVLQLTTGQSRLALAAGPPSTAAGRAVYLEYTVDPSRPLAVANSQPFHELNAAVYAASAPIASKLVITTTRKL